MICLILLNAKRIWFPSSSILMVTSVESRSIHALVVSVAVSYVKIARTLAGMYFPSQGNHMT